MRKLKSWIDTYSDYMETAGTPDLFKKWGGIAAVAGALERKVWVFTRGAPLYPNLYTILVAPPGVGKTIITHSVSTFWSGLEGHHVALSSLTSAGLADEVRNAQRNVTIPGAAPVQFNSLKISSDEMQVLIPAYDTDFMGKLTTLYDGHSYGEGRRAKENTFFIKHPQINMLAATTPKYLSTVIPESAWDLGFMSRCLLIFCGEQKTQSLFSYKEKDQTVLEKLKHDFVEIGNLYGQMNFEDSAAEMIDAWNMADQPPRPDHPRLSSYLARRTANLLKLMQVSCAARGDDRVIEVEDFERALEWLLEAEMHMPEIFKAMSASGDGRVLEDCHHALWGVYLKNGSTPIPRKMIYLFLQKRLPAYAVEKAIQSMESSGMMQPKTVPPYGLCYIPLKGSGTL